MWCSCSLVYSTARAALLQQEPVMHGRTQQVVTMQKLFIDISRQLAQQIIWKKLTFFIDIVVVCDTKRVENEMS